jgi:hypothetical protein
MTEFLRDPIWQFIGAALGFIAIVISVIIFFMQRRKKSLVYEIATNTSLLTLTDEIRGKVQILFEGLPVQNVHLVILHILNDGNIAITSSDYEVPLTFQFGEKTQILSAEIIRTTPDTLKPEFSLMKNSIEFHPTLLNSGDTILFKVLLAHYEGNVTVNARIMGVAEVKQVSISVDRLNKISALGFLLGIVLFFSVKFTGAGGIYIGAALMVASMTISLMADVRQKRNRVDTPVKIIRVRR